MIRSRTLTVLAGAMTAALSSLTAHAQGAATSTTTLEEVVVTAEKREVNLQKTAISIQVTSGEELRDQGKKRIEEIMDGVVGVQAQGAEVGASFYMRGIGNDRGQTGNFGTSPTQSAVAIVVDGAYQGSREAVSSGTLDLAQAEVMRGPQSTTLGASSLAGAVSLVSNRPAFQYEGYGSIEAGSYNKLGLEGVFNAPLSSTQALRIAATTESRDGFVSSGVGDSKIFIGRVKYRWKPSDKVDLVLTAQKSKTGDDPVSLGGLAYAGYYTPASNCGVGGVVCDGNFRGNGRTYAHVNTSQTYLNRSNPWDDGMTYDGWGHQPLARYENTQFSANLDVDTAIGKLSVVPSFTHGTLKTAEGGSSDFYLIEDNKYEVRQIDVNLSSKSGSRISWVAGYNYYYTNTTGLNHFVISPGSLAPGFGFGPTPPCPAGTSNCYGWIGIGESSQTTNSVYLNGNLSVTDPFRIIAGLRYTKDTKGAQGSSRTTSPGDPAPGDAAGPGATFIWGPTQSKDWSKVTYRAGFEYDVAPQSMAYATYSTGYQPGNVRWGMGAFDAPTEAQTLSQVTAGIKNRFLDNKLQFNTEIFFSTYHNRGQAGSINVGTTNGTGVACDTALAGGMGALLVTSDYQCLQATGLTIPTLKSQGADFEVNWLPTADDRLDFNLEYLKATQEAPEARSTPVTVASIVAAAGGSNTTAATALLNGFNARVQTFAGATLSSSPKYSANATYQHSFVLGSGAKIAPSVNLAYKSSYWTSFSLPAPLTPLNPGPAQQDAYTIANFALQYTSADGKFTANAYMKNIQNKPVLLNYEGPGPRGAANVSLGDPRLVGLILKMNL